MARRSDVQQRVQYLSAKRRLEIGLWDMYLESSKGLEPRLTPRVGSRQKITNLDDRTRHGATTELLALVASADAKNVKTAVVGFEHRFSLHQRAQAGSGAMLDVDSSADCQLSLFTVRMQSV